ncbi:discoidin domain-containing protein [Coraliomargarita sp. SDUM461004]|uniref:Discoidin domain-containing protein n=1 Tax=Thalassobacterium sedimentorum TaxID=3041258 RepID=A0ABU1AJ89_9BACT|nr:discoidin domain-containing protein [Coraliomargarita sp. SDUM461004]MDQ8194767.1 discoidin domain-containing protein [Coraliomargarita sp. SDUM461004]
MKYNKFALSSIIPTFAALFVGAVTVNADSFLLSDNTLLGGVNATHYPDGITAANAIATGATYTYLTDAETSGIGDTDSGILTNDASFGKLTEGQNLRVGGTGGPIGSWQPQSGATVLFDLKDTYYIDAVNFSVSTNGNAGIATYEAYVSTDNVTYTALGTWSGEKTVLDSGETNPGLNTQVSITAAALETEARYVKVYLSHWNSDHTVREYNQLALGEGAVWGTSIIPEPSSFALVLGAMALFVRLSVVRRR